VFSFLAALLLAPTAQASKQAASGSFYPTGGPFDTVENLVGDSLIITETWWFAITGTLSGDVVVEQMTVVELDTGKIKGEDVVTFTGTVAGESGSLLWFHEWTVVGGFAVGTWEIHKGSGTEGLENLEGEGTFVTDLATGLGTYSGYIEIND